MLADFDETELNTAKNVLMLDNYLCFWTGVQLFAEYKHNILNSNRLCDALCQNKIKYAVVQHATSSMEARKRHSNIYQ